MRKRNYFDNGEGFVIYVIFVEQLGNVQMISANINGLYSTSGLSTVINVYYSEIVSGITPVMQSRYYNSTVVDVTTSGSLTQIVSGLTEGLNYHFRVSAWNSVGAQYGGACESTPALIQPSQPPTAPADVTVTPTSDTSVRVSWKQPTDAGGTPLVAYSVDYDYPSPVLDVQQVSIQASTMALSGTFCLSFGGYSTTGIPYDATHSRLESALESLPSVGNVQVTQELSQNGTNAYGIVWKVTFLDNVGTLPLMQTSCNYLVGDSIVTSIVKLQDGVAPAFLSGTVGIFQNPLGSATVVTTNSVQVITVNASSVDLNGYFYVYNSGELSMPIDVYTSASDMQYYLESMLTIPAVSVTLVDHTVQSTGAVQNYGRSWHVTFLNSHAQSLMVSVGGDTGE